MLSPTKGKLERIVEAVRHGLEGDAAVEFVRKSGFAITTAGVARHLKKMGGRGHIMQLINGGKTNLEILETCLRGESFADLRVGPPEQPELFESGTYEDAYLFSGKDSPVYATAKLSLRLPSDVYEALRLAARAEGKNQNELIVDILTGWLSRMPGPLEHDEDDQE